MIPELQLSWWSPLGRGLPLLELVQCNLATRPSLDKIYNTESRATLGGQPIGNRHSQRKQSHPDNARLWRRVASWVSGRFQMFLLDLPSVSHRSHIRDTCSHLSLVGRDLDLLGPLDATHLTRCRKRVYAHASCARKRWPVYCFTMRYTN